MKLLNLGCGTTYHLDWVNLDLAPASSDVIAHDVKEGLPFADGTFDAVYHAHILEHLAIEEAPRFMQECVRVTKAGGIVRVVVPDLEAICRLYVEKLEGALGGDAGASADYDWIMLELYDQTVRAFKGGRMGRFLKQGKTVNEAFVKSRVGPELWDATRSGVSGGDGRPSAFLSRALQKSPRQLFERLRDMTVVGVVRLLGGRGASSAFREGMFRRGGEIHKWMYDRYSLGRLMGECGLNDVHVCAPEESGIPRFPNYQLDVHVGTERKPDSLYMEGTR